MVGSHRHVRPLYPREIVPGPVVREALSAPDLVWTGVEKRKFVVLHAGYSPEPVQPKPSGHPEARRPGPPCTVGISHSKPRKQI